jgi:protein ImuB
LRCEPELRCEGVAIFEGNGHQARVVAATRSARQLGVRIGMTLAQARARMPKLLARARDAEGERSAQEVLLELAEQFSPRVEDAEPGLVYLDVEGTERLFQAASLRESECELAQEMRRRLDALALPARIGIAASKLTARLAAGLPDGPNVIAAGEELTLLAPLPVHRLAPAAEVAATLERWGIASVGELARLPAAEVASRLGEPGRRLHTLARGLDPQPLVARQPPPTFREGMLLEWPVANLEPFLFLARAALERLCQRLQARGLGCRQLHMALRLEPDGHHQRALALPSPTRDAKTLLTLVRLDLEAHPPDAPIVGLTFTAHPDAPRLAQLSLLGPVSLSPDRLAETLARLFAMLGPGRIGSPRTVDGHRPERFQLLDYAPPAPPKVRPAPESGRGLLSMRVLRPAIELEVLTSEPAARVARAAPLLSEVCEAPPEAQLETPAHAVADTRRVESLDRQVGLFRRAEARCARPRSLHTLSSEEQAKTLRIAGQVRVASGPWELEENWWSQDRTERDYWDIELEGGGLYRIYRDRRDERWFVDGMYD